MNEIAVCSPVPRAGGWRLRSEHAQIAFVARHPDRGVCGHAHTPAFGRHPPAGDGSRSAGEPGGARARARRRHSPNRRGVPGGHMSAGRATLRRNVFSRSSVGDSPLVVAGDSQDGRQYPGTIPCAQIAVASQRVHSPGTVGHRDPKPPLVRHGRTGVPMLYAGQCRRTGLRAQRNYNRTTHLDGGAHCATVMPRLRRLARQRCDGWWRRTARVLLGSRRRRAR